MFGILTVLGVLATVTAAIFVKLLLLARKPATYRAAGVPDNKGGLPAQAGITMALPIVGVVTGVTVYDTFLKLAPGVVAGVPGSTAIVMGALSGVVLAGGLLVRTGGS